MTATSFIREMRSWVNNIRNKYWYSLVFVLNVLHLLVLSYCFSYRLDSIVRQFCFFFLYLFQHLFFVFNVFCSFFMFPNSTFTRLFCNDRWFLSYSAASFICFVFLRSIKDTDYQIIIPTVWENNEVPTWADNLIHFYVGLIFVSL